MFNLHITPNPTPKPVPPIPRIHAAHCLHAATGCGMFEAAQLLDNNFPGEIEGRSLGQLIRAWLVHSGQLTEARK